MTLLKQNRITWDRSEPEDTGRKQTRRMSGAQAMEPAQGFTPELTRELVATASSDLLGRSSPTGTPALTLLGSTDEQTMRYFILIVALLLDPAAVLLLLAATHRGRRS